MNWKFLAGSVTAMAAAVVAGVGVRETVREAREGHNPLAALAQVDEPRPNSDDSKLSIRSQQTDLGCSVSVLTESDGEVPIGGILINGKGVRKADLSNAKDAVEAGGMAGSLVALKIAADPKFREDWYSIDPYPFKVTMDKKLTVFRVGYSCQDLVKISIQTQHGFYEFSMDGGGQKQKVRQPVDMGQRQKLQQQMDEERQRQKAQQIDEDQQKAQQQLVARKRQEELEHYQNARVVWACRNLSPGTPLGMGLESDPLRPLFPSEKVERPKLPPRIPGEFGPLRPGEKVAAVCPGQGEQLDTSGVSWCPDGSPRPLGLGPGACPVQTVAKPSAPATGISTHLQYENGGCKLYIVGKTFISSIRINGGKVNPVNRQIEESAVVPIPNTTCDKIRTAEIGTPNRNYSFSYNGN